MPYDIHEEKSYSADRGKVFEAVQKSVDALKGKGKILSSKPEDFLIEVQLDKTVLGKVLGDRVYLKSVVQEDGEHSKVIVDAYPLDAVGRKLMFGARKGVTQTVIDWFFEHLDKNL